jgi:hypothetical protein
MMKHGWILTPGATRMPKVYFFFFGSGAGFGFGFRFIFSFGFRFGFDSGVYFPVFTC